MGSARFHLSIEQSINVLGLQLPLELDSMEFDQFHASVTAAVAPRANEPWVVDLSETSYLGSAVLGLLVNVRQTIKSAGGRLALCNLSPQMTEIFHACCLERMFTIVKTRRVAIDSLSR